MIGYLSGTVKTVRKNYIILATDHVGYKVFVTPQIFLNLEPGRKIELYIHTYVREDILALYGFASIPEQEFFEMLLSVSGIGPRLAMAVLSLGDLQMIKSGISSGDPDVFTKVSGIGRKTAERLIVELKEKVGDDAITGDQLQEISKRHSDIIDVLLALGYSRAEARRALMELPKDLTNADDKIRMALRSLAKQ